ncbi:MAG: DNA-3-methyladenine glycosylase I [Segniliparus sp.]|uniref:DNA-3-methyladenine glycosylase I n=1 Tax=Segniliparus sp. TaxID=2804064 RepID=UPI003F3F52BF
MGTRGSDNAGDPRLAPGKRCAWAESPKDLAVRELYVRYHDEEWGKAVRSGNGLYERFCLEAFQAGLSWITVLRKREAFRAAFAGFDPSAVAAFDDQDVERLMADAGIIRSRPKILAAIKAANLVQDIGEDEFASLLWSFAPGPRPRPVRLEDVPAQTPESTAMAKELRRRGFSFCGPTTCYAMMQATGMVDDHLVSCWVA